jgi:transcriptional regulator with XRE-family HTH domain
VDAFHSPVHYRFGNSPSSGLLLDRQTTYLGFMATITGMVTKIGGGRRVHLYITEHMAARGINDERMAGMLGVARETVWRWRTEQHRLNPPKIAAIAEALGVEPPELWQLPRSPDRPSLDDMLRDAPDEEIKRAATIISLAIRRGA